jgi:uncharacterized protein (TIGR00255 family)
MIMSMTGFGSSRIERAGLTVAVEAKSVNHRYLDVHIRLPPEFQNLEAVVREVISGRLRRGRIDMFVKIDQVRNRVQLTADPTLIASYVELADEIRSRFPIKGELTIESISKLPGAIQISSEDLTEEEEAGLVDQVKAATETALDQLIEMRAREGDALVKDLEGRTDRIRRNVETIRKGATGLVQHYRDLLTKRVSELAPTLEIDSNRLEVEVLMYAEKSDIAEEVTRLDSHLEQFDSMKTRESESGKRMDFLLQEMNREVTTILSKTSGLNESGGVIGAAAIDIKVEIDKLREQVQNIE